MESIFYLDAALPGRELEPGKVSRKVKARGGRLMMVEVRFEAGASGSDHDHPHEQATYCLEGRFEFHVGNESRTLGPGDSVYVKGGAVHGTTCLEKGRLLDVFSPQREDFLE